MVILSVSKRLTTVTPNCLSSFNRYKNSLQTSRVPPDGHIRYLHAAPVANKPLRLKEILTNDFYSKFLHRKLISGM